MSVQLRFLNFWSKYALKPMLARSGHPKHARKWFKICVEPFLIAPSGFWQTRDTVGGVDGLWTGAGLPRPSAEKDGVILYIHGGGFVFGSPESHVKLAADLAGRTGRRAFVPRYRLAPEHPFPAGITDVIAAYDGLRASGIPAHKIVLAGDSAGGNFALLLLAHILAEGQDPPAGLVGLCPVVDLTFRNASVTDNAASDRFLSASEIPRLNKMYLHEHPADDPKCSPYFADFTGAPPVLLHASSSEFLRDDSLHMAEKLQSQGVAAQAVIFDDLIHVWHIMRGSLPEANQALDEVAAFINGLPEPAS